MLPCCSGAHRAAADVHQLAPSIQKEPTTYSIRAVVHHHGNDPKTGHYTAEARESGGEWFKFDDSQVVSISGPTIKDAYLLFYSRVCADRG